MRNGIFYHCEQGIVIESRDKTPRPASSRSLEVKKSFIKNVLFIQKTVSHSWDISLTVTLPRHKLHLVPKDYNSGPQRHIFSLFLFDRKNNSLGRTH